jgi:hypothetical protein
MSWINKSTPIPAMSGSGVDATVQKEEFIAVEGCGQQKADPDIWV